MGILVNQNQIGGGSSNSFHNIGDIFYTTRTDNSLNGAVECNGSQYNFSDFDSNLQSLLDNGSIPSVTISEFDSIVSEKGWCDKIGYKNNIILYPVWSFMKTQIPENRYNGDYYTNIYWGDAEVGEDGTLQGVKLYERDTYNELVGWYVKRSGRYDHIYDENNEIVFSDYGWESYNGEYAISVGETESTYFKVPKLSAYIIQKENIPVIGNGMTVGMTDGTKTGGLEREYTNSTGSFFRFSEGTYGTQVGSVTTTAPNLGAKTIGITTDSTKSGIIADTSDVATTERVMIQLFNGSIDTALATCTSVLADVSSLKSYDYAVETQEASDSNNYTWYRLYKSGWVEQGGYFVATSGTNEISLPVQMKGIYKTYSAKVNACVDSSDARNAQILSSSSSTILKVITNSQFDIYWEVKGMSNR